MSIYVVRMTEKVKVFNITDERNHITIMYGGKREDIIGKAAQLYPNFKVVSAVVLSSSNIYQVTAAYYGNTNRWEKIEIKGDPSFVNEEFRKFTRQTHGLVDTLEVKTFFK